MTPPELKRAGGLLLVLLSHEGDGACLAAAVLLRDAVDREAVHFVEDVKAAAEVYLPAIVKADVTVVLGVEVISEVDASWGEVIGYSVKYVNDFRNVLIVVVG